MSLLAWFAIVVGWLAVGTLLGMAKWTTYFNDTVDAPLHQRLMRGLFFPISSLEGWEGRRNIPDTAPIADHENKGNERRREYLRGYAIYGPTTLLWSVLGLVGGPVIYVSRGTEWLLTKAGQLISRGWERITKRNAAKSNDTKIAIARLTELRDNELFKQQGHLISQRDTLQIQVSRLRHDHTVMASRVEQLATANDQFVGAYRTTLRRIEQLLTAKQQELACTEKALPAILETMARLSSIVELVSVSAYMDTIDPRTNDSSQQLLRDAYASMEACRTVIARAQSISVGVQADGMEVVDVDELARQVDAGWMADEKQIRENGKLLTRLAETPGLESPAQPAPRQLN